MEQNQKTPPTNTNREFVFRIFVCAVAVLALSTAITFIIRSIVMDSNATKRLLAEAFMSYESESPKTPETAKEVEAVITSQTKTPTETTAKPEPEDNIALVSASLAQNKASINNYTSYAIDEIALRNHKFEF